MPVLSVKGGLIPAIEKGHADIFGFGYSQLAQPRLDTVSPRPLLKSGGRNKGVTLSVGSSATGVRLSRPAETASYRLHRADDSRFVQASPVRGKSGV